MSPSNFSQKQLRWNRASASLIAVAVLALITTGPRHLALKETSTVQQSHIDEDSKASHSAAVGMANLVIICPDDEDIATCQTQAQINAAYAAWLADVTTSGGCDVVVSNNSTGPPSACGGSVTVTFTATSTCDPSESCMATFSVMMIPDVVLTCPAPVVTGSCQSQAAINLAYGNWLNLATSSGGCNSSLVNDSGGVPSACGGVSNVTFTVFSDCEGPVSCMSTFTVDPAPLVILTCPVDQVDAACQSQAAIDLAFSQWLTTVSTSGGCTAVLTDDNTGAPSACGGSTTVVFTVNSNCEPPVTCAATFTVLQPDPIILTCPSPSTQPYLQTQAFIDAQFAAWLATASASGGCNGQLGNNNAGAPSACGGSTTVTFFYTSDCQPFVATCSQTFNVLFPPASLRVAKHFAGIDVATSGLSGNFDVIAEIIVQNTGTVDLQNFVLLDNLGAPANLGTAFVSVTQAPQIVAVGAHGTTTDATTLPNLNPTYNGTGDLLNGGGLLQPGELFVVQFRFEVNPDASGAPAIARNQAQAFGSTTGFCNLFLTVDDLSDSGFVPLSNNTGWPGDTGGSNDPTPLTNCWSLISNGISCNDQMQISVNQNCVAQLTPDMVLEGEYQQCSSDFLLPLGSYYQVVMVTTAFGEPVPDLNPATPNVYEISGSYIGQYLTVKIMEKVYGNNCWGQIFLEDKLAPVFDCPTVPVLVFCNQNLAGVPPPAVLDNCDPNPVITLVGSQTIDNDICDDGVYRVRRTWKATDVHGNMTICVQNLDVVRPPVDFPEDITWTCTQFGSHPTIVDATTLHPSITDTDLLDPGINVSPALPDSILANTGSGTVNVNYNICAYQVLHTDQTVAVCGTSFKIIRTWTVIDWCTGDIVLTGVGGEDNVQIIKVMDNVAPVIVRVPFEVSANVTGVHPQPCRSTGFLLPPTVSDNCNAVTVQIITGVGEAEYIGSDGSQGGFIPAPGLSVGTHQVTYIATDACGNQSMVIVPVTVVDDITPAAVCDELTDVNLSTNGTATVLAITFDDGSSDNCCVHHFEVRRMEDPCDDGHNDTVFGTSVVFCCEDVANSPVMVVFRVFDCFGNFNDCMVQVEVNDKIAPLVMTCPPPQRITCDVYTNNYETQLAALGGNQAAQSELLDAQFGTPVFFDNCDLTIGKTVAINITQCQEGTITRTWTATDPGGLTSPVCAQTISVDHVSDWVVTFPADTTVNCGQSVPDFGEPQIFYETCELVAVSYDDSPFIVVPDACYKIIRTWQVINWCVIGALTDQEVVEVPENQLGLPFPQCDLDGDGDCDNRTFRDSWTLTQKPSAAQANQALVPDTDPDSDPWDGFITYQQTIKIIDTVDPVFVTCEVPDMCITDTTVCFTTVNLPTPTVLDCSTQVTITASTTVLGAGFGPFLNVAPGTYTTTFVATDNCNNTTVCTSTFEVMDCTPFNIYCVNGLIVEIMDVLPPTVGVNASELNAGSTDNCAGPLVVSFSPDVNDTQMTFFCTDLGINPVEIWFTDAAGNQDFCATFITIQANMGQCDDDTLVVHLGGYIANEDAESIGNVAVNLSGQSNQSMTTSGYGSYLFSDISVGQDLTLTPTHDVSPLQGVTTYDLVLISKHILNIQALDSPYKMIAADVNNSKSITTFDLVELRKLVLFINTEFPNNTSWRFVAKDYVFPVPTNPWVEPFPEIISINNIPADVMDADFVAVKIGDVNNSSGFAGGESGERSRRPLVFETKNLAMVAGETYGLDFTAHDFEAEGYQFTLEFDTELLDFVEVAPGAAGEGNFGLTKLGDGAITASWNRNGEIPAHDGPIFSLVFKAKSDGRLAQALHLTNRFTPTEAYGFDGEMLDVQLQFTENEQVAGFELFQNKPNPFSQETVIGFRLPASGSARLTITDVSGRVVRVLEDVYPQGYNEVRLGRDELPANGGILYYQLEAESATATKMMLLVE
ncbi:MAG: hypothetical protein HY842_01655 [Bacteroidetes bacterium]|nr:hypothetical protein [Bacteroidota bacterium]